jgi:hypothetical protein
VATVRLTSRPRARNVVAYAAVGIAAAVLLAVQHGVPIRAAAQGNGVPATPHQFGIVDTPGHSTALYPGASQPRWVRLTNPNNFDILVTALTATAGTPTDARGRTVRDCPALDLTVAPLSAAVRVRANSYADTALTARLAPTAPDACKNLNFPLTYSGTATKP